MGDIEKSTNGLSQAEAMFSELARDSLVSDPSRSNELDTLASMCGALESFQKAQVSGDATLFLEAREIFKEAAEHSVSKSLKPLLLGLASFAEFLHTSKKLEQSLESNLDIELVVRCEKAIDDAELMFRKLKYKTYLSLLKASKHILDATIKMSAAEREVTDTEEKARLYDEAQKSLSLASRYYQSLGSSKRVKESLRMIGAVRSHQRLIPLAHDMIAEVASNQLIYSAISSSAVFERSPESSTTVLSSAYVVLDGEIPRPVVNLGESFSFILTLSNLGKEAAITVRIDEILPEGFEVIECPYPISGQNTLTMNIKVGPEVQNRSRSVQRPAHPENTCGTHLWCT